MKYTVFLLALLLGVMALFPLLHTGDIQPVPAASSQQAGPQLRRQELAGEGGETPAPANGAPAGSEAAPSQPQGQPAGGAAVPLSRVESLQEPVLLYDAGSGRVLKISQQEYVLGAVCSEMPPSFHPQALKAQAVAAHSYVLRCKKQEQISPTPALEGAYLAVDTAKREGYVTEAMVREMYGDKFGLYYPAVKKAVEEVADQILVYEEQPIVAAYHSISAGHTEDAANVWSGRADYLTPVESPGDRLAPNYQVTQDFTQQEVAAALQKEYPDIRLPQDPAAWFTNVTRSASGYITKVDIGGTQVEGMKLRFMLGLRSSDLEIAYRDGAFSFTATGYGHGVGMSQYGADYMARQGAGYAQILAHYYTGAQLVRLQ